MGLLKRLLRKVKKPAPAKAIAEDYLRRKAEKELRKRGIDTGAAYDETGGDSDRGDGHGGTYRIR